MNSSYNSDKYTKITVYDIEHQDTYYVYKDNKGYYYDITGKLINIDKIINHNTSYHDEISNNISYKNKKD